MIVSCVFVRGNVPFTMDYVERLRSMISRRLHQTHEFVLLTDQPGDAPRGMTVIRVPTPTTMPGWWSKLEVFNKRHGLRGPGLYLDLDVLVVGKLDEIAAQNDRGRMSLIPHAGDWNGRGGLRVIKKYNSSVMRFRHEECFDLHDRWSPAVAGQLWGDQDWIGLTRPSEATMPLEWFPRLSQIDCVKGLEAVPPEAKIVLCKKPKNHEAAQRWRWFDRAWS